MVHSGRVDAQHAPGPGSISSTENIAQNKAGITRLWVAYLKASFAYLFCEWVVQSLFKLQHTLKGQ
jgi:hypothetical protein